MDSSSGRHSEIKEKCLRSDEEIERMVNFLNVPLEYFNAEPWILIKVEKNKQNFLFRFTCFYLLRVFNYFVRINSIDFNWGALSKTGEITQKIFCFVNKGNQLEDEKKLPPIRHRVIYANPSSWRWQNDKIVNESFLEKLASRFVSHMWNYYNSNNHDLCWKTFPPGQQSSEIRVEGVETSFLPPVRWARRAVKNEPA